jgi:predicted alpha/beta superfamily hydrolase
MQRSLILSFFILLFIASPVNAQVTFTVKSLPSYTPPEDSLYIAGNFTGWEPGAAEYMLHKNALGKWNITLAAQPSGTTIKFKFTRGSWETVEKGPGGEEIADRTFVFGSVDSVDVTIANWADAGGGGNSTAASNVKIISTDFYIPQLNRTRRIWMYFPPDYETSEQHYPVLYMHDGQNLFDAITSFSGEWEVDETLNTLSAQGKRVPIVVGIDNGGGNRIAEYTPWTNQQYGGGDGEKYIQFLVETLKPFIDQNYRTLPDRENTGIMGSSLGGLISHFGSLTYQETFGKAGLFSPSYWFSDSVWGFTHESSKQEELRFYQLCGTNESAGMVAEMQRMNDSLVSIGFGQDKIANKIVTAGQHNEKLWREGFGEAYLWLFNSYSNSVSEPQQILNVACIPNPVEDVITFLTEKEILFDTILILDINGRQVKIFRQPSQNSVNVSDLPSGSYIFKCINNDFISEGKFIKK